MKPTSPVDSSGHVILISIHKVMFSSVYKLTSIFKDCPLLSELWAVSNIGVPPNHACVIVL